MNISEGSHNYTIQIAKTAHTLTLEPLVSRRLLALLALCAVIEPREFDCNLKLMHVALVIDAKNSFHHCYDICPQICILKCKQMSHKKQTNDEFKQIYPMQNNCNNTWSALVPISTHGNSINKHLRWRFQTPSNLWRRKLQPKHFTV